MIGCGPLSRCGKTYLPVFSVVSPMPDVGYTVVRKSTAGDRAVWGVLLRNYRGATGAHRSWGRLGEKGIS